MIDPTVEPDVRHFIASLALMCKGCMRRGYTCATCPSATATVLNDRIRPNAHLTTASEERARDCRARREEIIAKIRSASPAHCFAIDIKVKGCASNLRSMVLADLVKDGTLERHDMGVGKPPSYTIKEKEAGDDEGQE